MVPSLISGVLSWVLPQYRFLFGWELAWEPWSLSPKPQAQACLLPTPAGTCPASISLLSLDR